MTKEHTSEEIKYRLSDLGVQIGNIAIEYITDLEHRLEQTEKELADYQFNYPTIKELQEEIATLKHNKKTVAHLSSCISDVQKKKIAELELEIKKLTQHLEPQLMTDLLKQVREEVEQEQRITELEAQIEKMKCCYNCSKWNDGQCTEVSNDNSYYSADFVCEDWEIKEK